MSSAIKAQIRDEFIDTGSCSDKTDHEAGGFAEIALAKAAVQIKIPDNVTDIEAATLGISTTTVVRALYYSISALRLIEPQSQGLYKALKLPQPNAPAKEPFPVLIYGGSTATGVAGIQYAKASGLTVVATASPHNFDYLKSLGADAVFDYKSPTCAADIKAFTNNKLRYSWDCTGYGAELCAAAMSDTDQGFYGTIIPVDAEILRKTNPKVEGPFHTVGYDMFGEDYYFAGKPAAAKPDEFEFAVEFIKQAEELLAKGIIKPIKTSVNSTGEGLEGALKGLDELRNDRVSGTKLVYTF